MRKRGERGRSTGYTIIELLVVILVIAILMSVALPLYLDALTRSERTTCRANMDSIAQAEQGYRLQNRSHTYTTDLSLLHSNLGSVPTCPTRGVYSVEISDGSLTGDGGAIVPKGGILVRCSVSAHGTYIPGVDQD